MITADLVFAHAEPLFPARQPALVAPRLVGRLRFFRP
jgi:hypothetical protein